MKGETGERWRRLCEQAAIEQDPLKLMRLVTEINRLLLEKEERLVRQEQDAKEPGCCLVKASRQLAHAD
jgi:hypothetical protein